MSGTPPVSINEISGKKLEQCDCIIGLYMRIWGDLESSMAMLIQKFLDTDMITSQIIIRALDDMRSQRELTAELGKHRLGDSNVKTLERLLDRVKAASTRRNRIVHGKWVLSIEMGKPPNPKPLVAKSARWIRRYYPSQQDELQLLLSGKNQKLSTAYDYWPEQILKYTESVGILANELHVFATQVVLRPARIPLPIEW